MKVQVRYFASLREAIGASSESHSLPPDVATVGSLRHWLMARDEKHAEALAISKAVRASLNQSMCADNAALKEGDEVAFFPPVTGG